MWADEDFLARIIEHPDDRTAQLVYADWLDENGRPEKAAAIRSGVARFFGRDFDSPGGALTLPASEVSESGNSAGHFSRTHPDGWTIAGTVCEDWYYWVNDFDARHDIYGLVWGNFEQVVFASSEEAFRRFYLSHTPEAWDYHDI